MALTDENLTIKEAQEFLALNGVDWSIGWIKTQVLCGRIPSFKIYSSRVISRAALSKILFDKKRKREGLA